MIANLIGGLLMIAAGLFPLYFGLSNWWWIAGGVMIVFGGMVVYSGCRCRCSFAQEIDLRLSPEEIDKVAEELGK